MLLLHYLLVHKIGHETQAQPYVIKYYRIHTRFESSLDYSTPLADIDTAFIRGLIVKSFTCRAWKTTYTSVARRYGCYLRVPKLANPAQQYLRNCTYVIAFAPLLRLIISFTCRAWQTHSSKEVHLLRVPKLANPAQQYLLDCWRSMLLCLHPWVDCQIIHVARHRSVARRYIFRVCQNWQTQHSSISRIAGEVCCCVCPRGLIVKSLMLPGIGQRQGGTFATCTKTRQQQQQQHLWN